MSALTPRASWAALAVALAGCAHVPAATPPLHAEPDLRARLERLIGLGPSSFAAIRGERLDAPDGEAYATSFVVWGARACSVHAGQGRWYYVCALGGADDAESAARYAAVEADLRALLPALRFVQQKVGLPLAEGCVRELLTATEPLTGSEVYVFRDPAACTGESVLNVVVKSGAAASGP